MRGSTSSQPFSHKCFIFQLFSINQKGGKMTLINNMATNGA
uniref:Uncharacterized protein n=1 Tax=Anguilla anguilla TaxID=7936 RepID=A0A0E9QIA0_ANGAN